MMKKKATGKPPRGPRTTPSRTNYKPLSASTTRKQVDAKLKEAPAKIKISNVKVSTRENFGTSQRRASSMTSSGLPRASKPVAPKPTKKATPKPKPKSTLGPLPKNPTLNDYLIRGMKPPVQGRKKLPSDADVRLRGYNA